MGSTEQAKKSKPKPWRSLPADLSDEEWDLIADLVPTYSGGGRMGRPAKWSKRQVVDAILYVAATGCQWRALPPHYPHWNTVHRYHLTWSRDGTWDKIVDRLRALVRAQEGATPTRQGRSSTPAPFGELLLLGLLPGDMDAAKKVSGRRSVRAGRHYGPAGSCRGRSRQPLRQRGRYHHFGPCRNQGGPAPKDMARQRVQENLRRSLLRIRHLPRSRGTDRPSLLSGPTPPLGSRTHLGMAHQPPASTNRLRTRPRRNRRIHMGSPHPSTPPPTHPTNPQPHAQHKLTRQLIRACADS